MSDTGRLTNLELLFTHLERQVQELNDVVLSQQQRIERLEKQLRLLGANQGDAEEDLPGDGGP
jgi:uncharacterized coiled-coil protein SlyX